MAINTATIIEYKKLTEDVFELSFKPENPINFSAGQFITFKIDDAAPPCFRAYSISSSPQNPAQMEVCVKIVANGRGSNWLNKLKINDKVQFIGPNGKFVFNAAPDKKVLFIATGTGIAPFKSMIEDQLLSKNNKQQMHLLFGLRHINGIFYKELFEDLAAQHPNFKFDLTLSRPENGDWPGKTGRVTDLLQQIEIDPRQTEVYICGLKDMIESVGAILKEKGLPEEAVHFEKYD